LRVYVDGIFDLFHVGHLRILRNSKNVAPNVHLVVGVVGDEVAKSYKRPPIIDEQQRAEIVSAIPDVDELVVPAPLQITKSYVAQHRIDLIVHGFADERDRNNFMKRHAEVLQDRPELFLELPYTAVVSTTDIMKRCKRLLDEQQQQQQSSQQQQ
jgi:cytidyltransferase-like protein